MLNQFPGVGNYALPTFLVPQVPPDADPDEGDQVYCGFSAAWLPYVLAALDQLCQYASWDADAAGKLLAVQRADTLRELIAVGVPVAPIEIDTPFWDTGTDVDDQLPPGEQPWYGEISNYSAPPAELDFVENAGIWLLTGFVAYAAGVGPAIFFHSIAPRFALAFKRGDVGEIWRIVVNSADQASVDTSAASAGDVVRQNIVPAASETGYDVMLVKVG